MKIIAINPSQQNVNNKNYSQDMVSNLPQKNDSFSIFPEVPYRERCIEFFKSHLESTNNFVFTKINHGGWEALVKILKRGLSLDILHDFKANQKLLNQIDHRCFANDAGMLADTLDAIKTLPEPTEGFNFLCETAPCYLAREIEGTPLEGFVQCNQVINYLVPPSHVQLTKQLSKKFAISASIFKDMVTNGQFITFLEMIKNRNIIMVCSNQVISFFENYGFKNLTSVIISHDQARANRYIYLENLREILKSKGFKDALPPLIIYSGGGQMGVWLAKLLWQDHLKFHFIDIGVAAVGLNANGTKKANWTKMYQRQIAESIQPFEKIVPGITKGYKGEYGIRNPKLVSLLHSKGVPLPKSTEDPRGPLPIKPIPFIENKIYDYQRIKEILSLSVQKNHHANGGPVVRLLELVIERMIGLPESRSVIAVSSGTAALHLACSSFNSKLKKNKWVTSAFGFYSANTGSLADTQIIDCAKNGKFSLEQLSTLDQNSFDGVIYTNVFSQYSDWDDVKTWCEQNGKHLVVDNATGLFDRPQSGFTEHGCIEIISAHHTKPWGVGECGFLIVPKIKEEQIRALANFGVGLDIEYNSDASNFKLSDIAAAAVLDRFERFQVYHFLYERQARRTLAVARQMGGMLSSFPFTTSPRSIRAFTPYLFKHKISSPFNTKYVQFGKYYKPLIQADGRGVPTPNAQELYDRCICISNSPAMRLASDDEIIADLKSLV